MTKVIFTALALALVGFAGSASADWTCGDIGFGFVDTCTGDTNADNPYAGCDGDWRDIIVSGTYVQVCTGDGTNLWVCPNSNSYSVDDPRCVPVRV